MKYKFNFFTIFFCLIISFALVTNGLFGGGGEKLEKPGKDESPVSVDKELEKPGKEEKLVKPGQEETQKTETEQLVKPGKEGVEEPEREKLQKPRKEDFQKSKPAEEKEVITTGEGLEIVKAQFYDIFPVFYKYYDENPLGIAVIHNWEKIPTTDINVTVFVRQYMDIPKECKTPGTLEAGEEAEIELTALFNNKVLEITEGTKVAAEIIVEYTHKGTVYESKYSETIRIFDRNAINWDDDRKAAAFVTAKDPVVLRFSKNVAGMIQDKGSKAVDKNLLMAMALHEAISLYGMSYVIDPTTPYAEFSANKQAVDFLQFPKQTLEYRAGDCDDLSILYSALLESVGVETSFITIPGHIFMAFAVAMDPEQARKRFSRQDELIFRDEKVWIPVEVTEIGGGFLKAWQTGAQEWREAVLKQKEGFYPMHSSWSLYEPVGLPGDIATLTLPSSDTLVSVYLTELIKYIDREIYSQLVKIEDDITKSGETAKLVNKRGVLYARYGVNDKAEMEFTKSLSMNSKYMPALMNLGNIYYLNDEMERALELYERATRIQPKNPKVLLCVTRANHELENYGSAKKTYNKLKKIDPDLAVEYAYLDLAGDDATRAANMSQMKDVMIWEEEE